jgi:hypothetical protein
MAKRAEDPVPSTSTIVLHDTGSWVRSAGDEVMARPLMAEMESSSQMLTLNLDH